MLLWLPYISPPNTTDFAIMFVPIEGLFAEILREPGIMETLRSKYKIALTGPTTLSALLNSLQMGFRTLLVQERSSEVWNILAGVKSEFATTRLPVAAVRKIRKPSEIFDPVKVGSGMSAPTETSTKLHNSATRVFPLSTTHDPSVI